MKKNIIIVSVVIVVICVVFIMVLLNKKERSNDLEYDVQQIISLESNPTTGYMWTYVIDNESIAKVESEDYISNSADGNNVGVGGIQSYTIVGLNEGETKITFTYMRPWESVESANKVLTYIINVNKNREIAVIKQ